MATDNFLCMPPVGCVRGSCSEQKQTVKTFLSLSVVKTEDQVAHPTGSEIRRVFCEAAQGPEASPPPPSPPPPECDPSAVSRTGCALPRWDWNKSRGALKRSVKAGCQIVSLTVSIPRFLKAGKIWMLKLNWRTCCQSQPMKLSFHYFIHFSISTETF